MRLTRRRHNSYKVAILGAGPAGLLSAHAAALAGVETIHIYSLLEPSVIRGAQYLHELPAGIFTDNEDQRLRKLGLEAEITYNTIGSAQQYRDKVYGPGTIGAHLVSPTVLNPIHWGFDIRQVYKRLWEMYSGAIAPTVVDAVSMDNLVTENNYNLIVSTIPKPALCISGHQFAAADINVAEISFVKGQNVVVCDGRPAGEGPSWYRSSRIFGIEMTEWPGSIKPPIPGITPVKKPIRNTCVCWSESSRILHTGRYGKWEKGALAHHAFAEVYNRIEEEVGS